MSAFQAIGCTGNYNQTRNNQEKIHTKDTKN